MNRDTDWIGAQGIFLGLFLTFSAAAATVQLPGALKELNPPPVADSPHVLAIVGATMIDGRGGSPVSNSVVLIQSGSIIAAGARDTIVIPAKAERYDASQLTLVPGLMDAHFHMERDYKLPRAYLERGVTSLRDPSQWVSIYEPIIKSEQPQPRCFVSGPHLDSPPHAHPADAITVTNAEQVRAAVNRFVDEGASHIKVYFRLPLDLIRVACEAAHGRGVPVTAHLELVDADEAIRAALDGVEHITSFGTVLAEEADAEKFRRAVSANNEARRLGRYELWSKIDLNDSPRVKPLLDLLVARKMVISPTLAVFERRVGDRGVTDIETRGFENMLKFTRMCHRAGVTLVVGSHSSVPKASYGGAYQREMELLAECGLTPLEVIRAATFDNARCFRTDARLGSIEAGKFADLVLLEANPVDDITALRSVRGVMLNGRWVHTNDVFPARHWIRKSAEDAR